MSTFQATDALTAAEFQDELRKSARFDRPLTVADPLAAALIQIEQHPSFAQSRLLTRILSALAYSEGAFRRAEVSTLDLPTRGLVLALMNACSTDVVPREAWIKAANAANTAQLASEA